MTEKRIEELTEHLRDLNIQQDKAIRELEVLTKTKTTDAEGNELRVGDPVRINNKSKFVERRGTITKIGKLVSIKLKTGQTTTRKAKNLTRQDADRK
jgi:tRNA nucleotidyltransferase (CCA-adding enzyme)